jgi:hypothetical protein
VELLRVELAADGVRVLAPESASASAASPYVSAEPDPCGVAKVATLTFTSGEVHQTRTVNLIDVNSDARSRVLAIAMADLVRQGLAAAKTTVQAPPAVTPTPQELDVHIQLERAPATPAPPSKAATSKSLSLMVLGGVETKTFAQGNIGLFGPRAGVLFPLGSWLLLDTDAGVFWGNGHDPLGDVDETVGTVGVGLLGTGGPGGVLLGVGPRIEAGVGWFRGNASAPTTVASSTSSSVLLLALSGVAAFRINGMLSGFVGLDVGMSAYGFGARAESAGEQRHVSDFLGPLFAARVGLGWSPGEY